MDRLYEERDTQLEQDKAEWEQHKEKHAALREAARKELGLEPSARDQAEDTHRQAPDVDTDRLEAKNSPVHAKARPERPEAPDNVRSYVDDYIADRGCDSADHEQFASNYGPEIEQEILRRAAEATRSTEPEAAPPLEPDAFVPEHYAEPCIYFEMGD